MASARAWIRFWVAGLGVAALFGAAWLGAPRLAGGYHSLALGLDAHVPYLPWMAPIYLVGYALPLAPLVIVRDPDVLLPGLAGLALVIVAAFGCFVLLPVAVPPPPWRGLGGAPLALAAIDAFGGLRGNCFPSLHVAFATYVAVGFYATSHPARHVLSGIAVAIAASTVTLKLHFLLDLPAGAALGGAAARVFAWPPLARWEARR